jgi:hypothetical protein
MTLADRWTGPSTGLPSGAGPSNPRAAALSVSGTWRPPDVQT